MACTHTPRQNKDDSAFEQGSNKTVIVIKNKNAISGCHGNQHSRTPGNVVKHTTEHKAAKQVKRLFIRLRHVVQCPLVRAQQRHQGAQNQAQDPRFVPRSITRSCQPGTGHRHEHRAGWSGAGRGDTGTPTHSCSPLPPVPATASHRSHQGLQETAPQLGCASLSQGCFSC